MAIPVSTPAPTALIVGCGYLGRRLAAALLARGVSVYGTTRSAGKASALAGLGVRPLLVSVTQRLTLASLRPALQAPGLDVFFLLPPGSPLAAPSPREVLIDGTRHVLDSLRGAAVHRAIMTSSTAVYGQTGGVAVDADTPPAPADERGQLLVDAERQWLAAGPCFHVARLAGLYGPGRIIGLDLVQDGAPLVGDPLAVLNLLHVDDAAGLLLAMAASPTVGRVELGVDDSPAPRLEYYRFLAQGLGVSPPPVLDDQSAAAQLGLNLRRLRRSASKRCDNRATRRRTGWAPRFPGFRAGLEGLLGSATGARGALKLKGKDADDHPD